jgi:predicted metal-binding membrane protein
MTRSGSVQAQAAVVGVLLAAAGLAWWSTAVRMKGMSAAPGADLGMVGWYTVTWAVMMAAMMLPSLAPAAAAATAARRHIPSGTVLLVGGYLLAWTLAGLAVYGVLAVASHAAGLAWASGGRWLSVGVLILASAYELTPIKRAFLTRCRCPLARASSRGRHGAIVEGMSAGVWCLGCSWALMAALFALGVMSLIWMALVAALLAVEKLAPWPRAGTVLAATVLTGLAFGVAAFPRNVPGLVVPGGHGPMATMSMTGGQR